MWVIEEIKAECSAPNTVISVFLEALFDAVMSPMWSEISTQRDSKWRKERWRESEEENGWQ